MLFKTVSIAAALTLAVLSTPTYAAPYGTNTTNVSVGYADLDVSSTAGAQALLNRIRGAARTACGSAYEKRDLTDRAAFFKCVDQAIDGAVDALNNPLVSQLRHGNTALTTFAGN